MAHDFITKPKAEPGFEFDRHLQAEEMAQWVKCLLLKQSVPEFGFPASLEKPRAAAHIRNPSAGEGRVETGRS